ncbi:MAG: thiolase family protein [Planctomycetota bacterium]
MTGCVILDGLRTPFCREGSSLAKLNAVDLGVRAGQAVMARTRVPESDIDALVAGNIGQPSDSANIGRVIGLVMGLPQGVPAHTVARNCASGIEAVTTAVEKIRSGAGKCILTVSTESMSQYPFHMGPKLVKIFKDSNKGRTAMAKLAPFLRLRPSHILPRVALLEGLRDPTTNMMMGDTADLLAREYHIPRAEQDAFALRSHRLASEASAKGLFKDEIAPVFLPNGESVEADVGPRSDQTAEALAKLKSVFDRRYGTVTVGNACGITDGAGSLMVAQEDWARGRGHSILARIKGYAWTGCDPRRMGLGPVSACRKVLKEHSLTFKDVDVIEINEAFAAQVLACLRELAHSGETGPLSMDRINTQGGAIALGHPVGATGARLILTVAHQLKRSGKRLGLASLCIGGGQGGAILLENTDV